MPAKALEKKPEYSCSLKMKKIWKKKFVVKNNFKTAKLIKFQVNISYSINGTAPLVSPHIRVGNPLNTDCRSSFYFRIILSFSIILFITDCATMFKIIPIIQAPVKLTRSCMLQLGTG